MWKAHRLPINCLLILNKNGKDYLVSGGDDFYVKVWDIDAEHPQLLHTYTNHSGPVKSLFTPDTQVPLWSTRFFSIGADNSVALFEFDSNPTCVHTYGIHSAPIVQVQWQLEQDYLLVTCADGALYIWELNSGQLEGISVGAENAKLRESATSFSKFVL